jgi:hypothetical protein
VPLPPTPLLLLLLSSSSVLVPASASICGVSRRRPDRALPPAPPLGTAESADTGAERSEEDNIDDESTAEEKSAGGCECTRVRPGVVACVFARAWVRAGARAALGDWARDGICDCDCDTKSENKPRRPDTETVDGVGGGGRWLSPRRCIHGGGAAAPSKLLSSVSPGDSGPGAATEADTNVGTGVEGTAKDDEDAVTAGPRADDVNAD